MKNTGYLLVALLVWCSACRTANRYVYSPMLPNNPILEEKGDVKVSGSISAWGKSDTYTKGYNFQAAYALTNMFAVTFSSHSFKEREEFDGEKNSWTGSNYIYVKYKRRMNELGAGVFLPINKYKTKYVNVFAGYGIGKMKINDIDERFGDGFYNANINRIYIQPSYNIVHENFSFSAILKHSFVRYNHIKTDYSQEKLGAYNMIIMNDRWFSFFEPAAKMSFNFPSCNWLAIESALSISAYNGDMSFSNTDQRELKTRTFNFSMGLSIDLTKMLKKSK